MSSDNYINLIAKLRNLAYGGYKNNFYTQAADALESVVRDRNEARAKALEEAADSLDYLGHTWSGSVATHLFRDAEKLCARAAAIREEEN